MKRLLLSIFVLTQLIGCKECEESPFINSTILTSDTVFTNIYLKRGYKLATSKSIEIDLIDSLVAEAVKNGKTPYKTDISIEFIGKKVYRQIIPLLNAQGDRIAILNFVHQNLIENEYWRTQYVLVSDAEFENWGLTINLNQKTYK
jgi:hypothetical protein